METTIINFINTIDNLITCELKMSATNDPRKLIGLRNIKSEFSLLMSRSKNPDFTDIIKKMYNSRIDTAEIYNGKNNDLMMQELIEKDILSSFIPVELTKDEVLSYLNTTDLVKEMKNFKNIQNSCKDYFGQSVDSKIIQDWIKSN